ncbi:MAG: translation elongation factor Ts [Thermoguttaceae bacterium]|nr:translation elongation factor Ts [Thermoguttaceae bacterium]
MAEITAAMVKEFRNKTGLPMMECKKALVEADGDQEKAIEIIRKAGKKTMEKRADRETEAGRIAIYKGAGGVTAMVEVLCESAPVTKNAEFIEMIEGIAKQLAEGPGAATVEELMAQNFPGKDAAIQVVFDDLVNKIREVFRFTRLLRVEGNVGTYVHHDNAIGVVLEVEGDNAELADNICMHIASMNPKALNKGELSPELIAKEREIATEQTKAANAGKPENIIAKIVEGRVNATLAEICLEDQPFVMDSSKKVGQAAKDGGLTLKKMHLWHLGK